MPRAAFMSLLLPTLLATSTMAQADREFHSGPQFVPMLELFTSEGCSSCPPADAWLARQLDNPKLWKTVVPIAWHVDYWNALGWPDRFSQPAYSHRQRLYEATGHVTQVYTPGLVYAGEEWRGYFRQAELPELKRATAGELTVQLRGQQLDVSFVAADISPQTIAHVALLGFGLETAITRGENAGKHLPHDFVVLAHQVLAAESLAPASSSSPLTATTTRQQNGLVSKRWHGTLPAYTQAAKRYALVSWLSLGQAPAPLQSTGGYLP